MGARSFRHVGGDIFWHGDAITDHLAEALLDFYTLKHAKATRPADANECVKPALELFEAIEAKRQWTLASGPYQPAMKGAA